jgi:hypothetical protein
MSTEELSVEAFGSTIGKRQAKPSHPLRAPAFEPDDFGAATRNRQLEHRLKRPRRTLRPGDVFVAAHQSGSRDE